MSMAKRADKLASDMREIISGMGDEEGDAAASPAAPTEEERPPAWAYAGAWLAAVAFLLAIMLGGRLIFTIGTGEDTATLGVQTREVSEPEYQAARDALREPTPTIAPATVAPLARPTARVSDVVSIPPHYHSPARGRATVGRTNRPPPQGEADQAIGFVGVPATREGIQLYPLPERCSEHRGRGRHAADDSAGQVDVEATINRGEARDVGEQQGFLLQHSAKIVVRDDSVEVLV